MIVQAVLPLVLYVAIETAEHLAYSLAGTRPSSRRLGWIAFGVGLHLLLLAAWCWLLLLVPLGIAMPLTGLSYVTIALASRVLLQERVGARSWFGIISIAIGFALVTA